MRTYIQQQIKASIDSVYKALVAILKLDNTRKNDIQQILQTVQEIIIEIGNTLEKNGVASDDEMIKRLEDFCEDVWRCTQIKDRIVRQKFIKKMQESILDYKRSIDEQFEVEPIKIAFFPYKADMWNCMEPIWEEARKGGFTVQVVLLPFLKKDKPEEGWKYEVERFPKELKIIDYQMYDLEKEHPEVIFFHNPYDDSNNLTTVPSQFYSERLRENTEMLIYAPYCTAGVFNPGRSNFMYNAPGTYFADVLLAQSEKMKSIYLKFEHENQIILDFGSPKIDYIKNKIKSAQIDIPESWKEKIRGKKVFLLNTHLSYFPNAVTKTGKSDNYAVKYHNEILKAFLNRDECALIWRPHPLLKTMIYGRFPQCIEYIKYFEKLIINSSNGIIDETPDYLNTFMISDAMLSTWSSLVCEYMVTEKPILVFQKKVQQEKEENILLDRNVNYFRTGQGGMSFLTFRDNVINDIDVQKEMRRKAIQEAFPNLKESASKKIIKYIEERW